jgi:molecular chaperone GrpE (heat shock protein)
MGAPLGNQNSSKANRLWAETIRRAVVQADPEKLRRIADKLLAMAEDGDIQAIKEVGDRLDGKPTQATELSGPEGQPLTTIVNFVTPSDGSSG